MTRDEAIETLKGMIKLGDLYEVDINACEVAIEALKQEPVNKRSIFVSAYNIGYRDGNNGDYCPNDYNDIAAQEPCEDAISRQAALDLMRNLTRWCVRSEDGKFNNVGLLYDDVMFGIDKLSSVKPQEPKTGHWRVDIDRSRGWDWRRFNCSECGSWQTYGETRFCPNCGAKMAQESEEQA